jgi:class 3 adenylate cyclase/tetratricopeptide (TPR) repeat protein
MAGAAQGEHRMAYEPAPIDTSGVTLSDGLRDLTELLAKNAHDLWAQQRLAEGWTHGPTWDDARKEHPGLVPYEALPEAEKTYDRRTAMETVKTLLALGYRIQPPSHGRTAVSEAFLGPLLSLWQARDLDQGARTPDLYRQLAEQILALGEPLVAYDVVTEGLGYWPPDVRLRQLQGLALARSGATERANHILLQLSHEGQTDGETLGLLARTYKDLSALATDPAVRTAHLGAAGQLYRQGYELAVGRGEVEEASYTGINAATTALLLGEREVAQHLAREVRALGLQALERLIGQGGDPYWVQATLGEAALILGAYAEAEDWYGRAAEVGRGRFGHLHSTRRQARLLLECLGVNMEPIERCLQIPRVAVFVGHMIDHPERPSPRFPPQLEPAVRKAIRDQLRQRDARIGYASAACGADILFLETILELQGEAHVILPYDRELFRQDSVDLLQGADWGERYARVLQAAAEVQSASEQRLVAGSVTYDYANILLYGLATIRAHQLGTDLIPLAVWDGRAGDGPGGTADTVRRWQELGPQVEVVALAELLQRECPALAQRASAPTSSPPVRPVQPSLPFPQEIMAMLFADAVGFSHLAEEQIPGFVQQYLGAVAALMERSPYAPVMKNTWGDGLYGVFATVHEASEFALDLCALVNETNWTAHGLPEDLSLRIALHAGPVYAYTNPVTGQPDYLGTHVSRAARLEPVTPPGQVYASHAFVALAAAQRVTDFTYEYVGQTLLAKGYGTFPTYHIRRRRG